MIKELHITQFIPTQNHTIWDVRDTKAYTEAHLQYAQNQPLETINAELLATVSVAEPIYVLCGGGTKAGRAAKLIESLDSQREVIILTGGTRAAKAAGMTIESE
ncbi:MAG: rhodanese-like domain-containing protein [Moraxellaceae bacterium]|nr:rhodanese-like domain-containing protein [Moraxellaceae bacterium]